MTRSQSIQRDLARTNLQAAARVLKGETDRKQQASNARRPKRDKGGHPKRHGSHNPPANNAGRR